jgi:TonB-linked SusC/RagA family outer membrane protein
MEKNLRFLFRPARSHPFRSGTGRLLNRKISFFASLLFMLLTALSTSAQVGNKVEGTVRDGSGQPLAGVTVAVLNTTVITVTDAAGKYKLNLTGADGTLKFSYVSFKTREVAIKGKPVIDITLQEDTKLLNDVVVIGYQSISRKDLTGAASVVKASDMKKVTANTVGEALQGLAAGVDVRSGGQAGQESVVQIRGIGNLSNNDPLYVIDGLVTTQGGRDFNPNDIESIQILKDASAAAIYGSLAANGVIIITTKKGKDGPMKINVSAKYGVENIAKRWDLTNNVEFADLNRQAYINAGKVPESSVATATFNPAINTDWQDAVIKTGSKQEYNVDFSGGSPSGSYLVSANYYNNDGTVIGTSYNRIGLRVNTEGKKGIFSIGENISLTSTSRDLMEGNPLIDMVRMLPVIPIYDPKNPGGYGYGSDGAYTFGTNPVAYNNLVHDNQYFSTLRGNGFAQLKPLSWLTYKFNAAVEARFDHYKSFRANGSWTYNQPLDPAQLYENRADYLLQLYENTVNFDHKFGKHSIDGVIGTSWRIDNYDLMSGSKQTYTPTSGGSYFQVLDAGGTNPQVGGNISLFKTFSYFARLNYNYDDRYLLSGTFRNDADSRFGEANRNGNFPSVSGAWRISKESFFKADWVSDLKLRASYGVLGNSAIGAYDRLALISLFPTAVFGSGQTLQNGAIQLNGNNENLKWEERKTLNLGFDAELFKGAFSISGEYYRARTSDVLIQLPLPQTSGFSGAAPYVNAADLQNTGVELTLAYRNNNHPFKYTISGNISTVKNKVTYLPGVVPYLSTGLTRVPVGQPIGEFYLLQTDGIFQNQAEVNAHATQPDAKPGDIRYVDVNKDGKIDNDDRTASGSPFPKFESGLQFNGAYKRFTVSVQFYGVYGNKIYNSVRSIIDKFDDNSNYRRGISPWTPTNPSTTFPRIAYSGDLDIQYNTRGDSNRWLENGSYLKLRNLEFGYMLPENILKKIGFSNLKIYASGQNLFTITKYTGLDPDIVGNGLLERGVDNGNYPSTRLISLGIQAGF